MRGLETRLECGSVFASLAGVIGGKYLREVLLSMKLEWKMSGRFQGIEFLPTGP